MCVVRGGHFWQLGSIASLATETTILVFFFVPNMASEAISECLIFLGEHAPRPPSLLTLTRTQWPYQSKTVGAGPAVNSLHLHGYSFVVLAPRLIPVPPSCLTSLPLLPSSLPLEMLSAFGLCGAPLSSYFTSAANRANIITSNGTRTSGNSIFFN